MLREIMKFFIYCSKVRVFLLFLNVSFALSSTFNNVSDWSSLGFSTKIPWIPFHHPLLSNLTSKEIAITAKNRCAMYPRCLLFDCCPKTLVDGVLETWKNNSNFFTQHFACSNSQTTSNDTQTTDLHFHSKPHHCRSSLKHNITTKLRHLRNWVDWTVRIDKDLVDRWLVSLPPTPIPLYQQLQQRKREDMRLLYLSMAPRRDKLEHCILTGISSDFLLLTYKDQEEDALFFPDSIFGYGRMALYAIARMIEFQQGWLYDYFVFIDDDADWGKGNLTAFEEQLKEYEPAIGSPGSYSFPNDPVESNIRIDPIFIAYHREALEVLHPFILDYDLQCGWSSQFLQDMEVSLGYRNHALSFKGMYVYNGLHRPYKRGCNYQELIDSTRSALPSNLRHCAITDEKDAIVKEGLYFQGRKVGKPHKRRNTSEGGKEKIFQYHYMFEQDKPFYSSVYSRFNQSGICGDVTKFTLEDEKCCSVDIIYSPLTRQ